MPQICQAHNAFRAPTALTQLFLSSTRLRLARSFSTSNRPRAIADASVTSAGDVSQQGPDGQAAMDPNVDPDSLSRTLDAHRRANRESIIRRVDPYNDEDASLQTSAIPAGAHPVRGSRPFSGRRGSNGGLREKKRRHNVTYNPREGSKSTFGMDFRGLRNTHKEKHQPLMYTGVDLKPLLGKSFATAKTAWPWTEGADPEWDNHQRLDYEIQKFHEWMVPTPSETAARQEVIRDVQQIIQDELGDEYSTEVFGSERCGIALATSDIDIRLAHGPLDHAGPKAPAPRSRKQNYIGLNRLFKRFQRAPNYRGSIVLRARYPLVSFTHAQSDIAVQVVASNDTTKSRNSMLQYMDTHPGLREIYTLVKASFDVRGISDVFHGGLGSYSLFMFIVASMNLSRGDPVEKRPLSRKLVDFLEFRSIIDHTKHGISVDPPGIFQKKPNVNPPGAEPSTKSVAHEDPIVRGRHRLAVVDPIQPYLLCLQDPADPLNDLGHKAYGIKHILASMDGMHNRLRAQSKRYRSSDAETKRTLSLLYPIVGDIESLYFHRRKALGTFKGEAFQSSGGHAVDSPGDESIEVQAQGSREEGDDRVLEIQQTSPASDIHNDGNAMVSPSEVQTTEGEDANSCFSGVTDESSEGAVSPEASETGGDFASGTDREALSHEQSEMTEGEAGDVRFVSQNENGEARKQDTTLSNNM